MKSRASRTIPNRTLLKRSKIPRPSPQIAPPRRGGADGFRDGFSASGEWVLMRSGASGRGAGESMVGRTRGTRRLPFPIIPCRRPAGGVPQRRQHPCRRPSSDASTSGALTLTIACSGVAALAQDEAPPAKPAQGADPRLPGAGGSRRLRPVADHDGQHPARA